MQKVYEDYVNNEYDVPSLRESSRSIKVEVVVSHSTFTFN